MTDNTITWDDAMTERCRKLRYDIANFIEAAYPGIERQDVINIVSVVMCTMWNLADKKAMA